MTAVVDPKIQLSRQLFVLPDLLEKIKAEKITAIEKRPERIIVDAFAKTMVFETVADGPVKRVGVVRVDGEDEV